MRQTGHRSLAMVRRYIRDGSLFRENPGGQAGAVKAAANGEWVSLKFFERFTVMPEVSIDYVCQGVYTSALTYFL